MVIGVGLGIIDRVGDRVNSWIGSTGDTVVVVPVAIKLGISTTIAAVVLGVGASVASGLILGMGYLAHRAYRWFRRDNAGVSRASALNPASQQNKATLPTETKRGWMRGLVKRVSGWFRGEQAPATSTPRVLEQAVKTDQDPKHHSLNTPPGSATSSLRNASKSGEHSPADKSDEDSNHTAVISHPTTRPHSPDIEKPDIATLSAQLKAVEKQLKADALTPGQIEDCCQQVEAITKRLKACSLAYHPDKTGSSDHAMMQAVNACRETFKNIKTRLEEIQAQESGSIHKLTSLWEQLNVLEREIDEQAIKLNEQAEELKKTQDAQAKSDRKNDELADELKKTTEAQAAENETLKTELKRTTEAQAAELKRVTEAQAAENETLKTELKRTIEAQAAELKSTKEAQAAQTLQFQALIATVQSLREEIGGGVETKADPKPDPQAGPSGVRTPIVMQAPRSRRNSAQAEEVPAMPAASADMEEVEQTEGRRSRRSSMSLSSSGGEE